MTNEEYNPYIFAHAPFLDSMTVLDLLSVLQHHNLLESARKLEIAESRGLSFKRSNAIEIRDNMVILRGFAENRQQRTSKPDMPLASIKTIVKRLEVIEDQELPLFTPRFYLHEPEFRPLDSIIVVDKKSEPVVLNAPRYEYLG